jgi:hypothetical protein
MAAVGVTPNSRISIGVISAPPAGAGHPDEQPDHSAAENQVRIQVHKNALPRSP